MKSNFLPSIARQLTACAATLLIAATTVAAQTEHVIYAFKGGNDGSYPTRDSSPTLTAISMAPPLAAISVGARFSNSLSPPAAHGPRPCFTLSLRHYRWPRPEAGLIFDRAGNLYGTTAYGAHPIWASFSNLPHPPPAAALDRDHPL